MTFKCRASSLGGLMTKPRNKSEALSETAKSVVVAAALKQAFDYQKQLDAKQIKKGLMLEDDAIKAISLLNAVQLSKNTERKQNDWLTGECDILAHDSIRDTKCSWSIDSHPWTQEDAEKKVKAAGYNWQGVAYMMLWDKPKFYVDFVLMPTPPDCLGFNDSERDHIEIVNNIPLHKRIRSVEILRDVELEQQAIAAVLNARPYFDELYNFFTTD